MSQRSKETGGFKGVILVVPWRQEEGEKADTAVTVNINSTVVKPKTVGENPPR
jgi:hypothetical protein